MTSLPSRLFGEDPARDARFQVREFWSEMMNFPGVLAGDADVLAKLRAAKDLGLPIDGHAPGLRRDAVRRYAAAGPSNLG